MSTAQAVNVDHPIVIKVAINQVNRKFKLPLRELNAATLPSKLRTILQIPTDQQVTFERFSDSSGAYLTLDPANPSTYKQLYRAAKAKLKLRLRVSFPDSQQAATKQDQSGIDAPCSSVAPEPSEPKPMPDIKPLPEVLQLEPESKVLPLGNMKPRNGFVDHVAALSQAREMGIRMKEAQPDDKPHFWQVYCNNCGKSLSDAHFHCGICDMGDYDLCEACVNNGKLCPGEDHWLIKRFIKNGKVVNSTTEKVAPPARPEASEKEPKIPGAFKSEVDSDVVKPAAAKPVQTRTCNSCIRVLPETLLVECSDCDDFDLCMPCHVSGMHGHHPGHAFKPVSSESNVSAGVLAKCEPGRNVIHAAICDKCDKKIIGVRHKCLDCPDWDFCNDCHRNAGKEHPGHRFVPIYDTLQANCFTPHDYTLHLGIYCDGPQCSGKDHQSYIRGDRYKCAICHDTDFCANCEAHPGNKHNPTHPLLKFKTPIKGVAVTTTGDDGQGSNLPVMGDRALANPGPAAMSHLSELQKSHSSAETLPAYTPTVQPAESASKDSTVGLDAHFVRDAIVDGMAMSPGTAFNQTWTLRNPGPQAWPVGCNVRCVGGDDMLLVDRLRPIDTNDLCKAGRSNTLDKSIVAGEEHSFSVCLRAPAREGKHISYWRLHTCEGVPFGHKLWCDIDSKTSPVKVSVTAPASQQFNAPPRPNGQAMQFYHEELARLEYENRSRMLQAHAARGKTAAAAAGKAWSSGPSVQAANPATLATDNKPVTSGPAPVPANSIASSPAGLHMRRRAMELQHRHRMLREQWKNLGVQDTQERQKLAQEMQQLQQSMQVFASAYRSPAQNPTAAADRAQLMMRQQARRDHVAQMPESEVKTSMLKMNKQLDAQDTESLFRDQGRRAQQDEWMRSQNRTAQQSNGSIANSMPSAAVPPASMRQYYPAAQPCKVSPASMTPTTAPTMRPQSAYDQYRDEIAKRLALQNQYRIPVTTTEDLPNPVPVTRPTSFQPDSVYAMQPTQLADPQRSVDHARVRLQAHEAQAKQYVRGKAMGSTPAQAAASFSVSSTLSQVKPKAPTVEDIEPATEPVEAAMNKSDMVMPKLERDGSPSSSTELKPMKAASEYGFYPIKNTMTPGHTESFVPSTSNSGRNSSVSSTSTTAAVFEGLDDDFESVGAEEGEVFDDAESAVRSEDDGFDTDEYDILDASDEEAMENARA